MTVVTNKDNELIPTLIVTGWRVCIEYRMLKEATRKDHFPLAFMDQMLERLPGNKFFCFLDGFSGHFQIPIELADREKTTFTCPYGTYAYKRMPFGLCNAPTTFQSTLSPKLGKVSTEGIDLGQKVSRKGLEVDKAKINVIAKLPPPTNVKAVRKAEALPTNDARVVFNFLKKLFSRFRILKALISNRGTHFGNSQMEKILKKYGVHHRIATAYHPQTSGQLHELDELRLQAYENTKLYKARTKAYHDKKLRVRKEFKAEDKVLLYNSKYKFKAPKLRSKWYGPFIVKHGYPSGYVELYDKHGGSFIVNGHRVKLYHDGEQLNELTI
ncbi:reverse transcriptase domain-containing protein [Tanacetum coccineum]